MSAFQLGPKVLIINSTDEAKILFYAKLASGATRLVETDDDFQTTTPFDDLDGSPDVQSGAEGSSFSPAGTATAEAIAKADLLRILGFGDFDASSVIEARGSKGIAPQKQISTLTIGAAAAVAGTEVVFSVEVLNDNLRAEAASYLSDYKNKHTFVVPVKTAGETDASIAARLVAQFEAAQDASQYFPFSASAAAEVITITSKDAEVSISDIKISGSAVDSGAITAAFAITTPAFSGRNTWGQLKAVRLETPMRPYAEDFQIQQIPLKGAKYSAYTIVKQVTREDGFDAGMNTTPVAKVEFTVYLNEGTCSAMIADLTKWLNANVARRIMYTATTAADAIAAENPTPTTAVDSTAPYTDGLV